jgi:glyoxylase-like metal-dependent hydrolase (beta-lactamase superfamily II)
MRQVLPCIYIVEDLRISNVFLIVSDSELSLIDAGMVGEAKKIVAQLNEAGFDPKKLKRIILTHAHGDHTGSVQELISISNAQVVAHRDEVSYIMKTKTIPANSPVPRVMNWLSDHVVFRQPGVRVDVAVEDGELIEGTCGLFAIHSPGHTPGSLSIYDQDTGLLFCGDALFNAHPITRKPGLQFPLRSVNSNPKQARESAIKLAMLDIKVLCCGHGEPITGDARNRMLQLLSSTERKV